MPETQDRIAEANARALMACRDREPGADWLSHPYRGFVDIAVPGVPGFAMFTNNDCTVCRDVMWEGGYEALALRLWASLARQASVAFDVGANTGVYSIAAALANPGIKVASFEPLPVAFHRLAMNIDVNGVTNVHLHAFALGDRSGTQAFEFNRKPYALIHNGGRLVGEDQPRSGHVERLTVETKRLDDLVRSTHDLGRVLMKLDVEGAELTLLDGAMGVISRFQPDILCEIFNQSLFDQIQGRLGPLGYAFHQISETTGTVNRHEGGPIHLNDKTDRNWLISARDVTTLIPG